MVVSLVKDSKKKISFVREIVPASCFGATFIMLAIIQIVNNPGYSSMNLIDEIGWLVMIVVGTVWLIFKLINLGDNK